MNPVPRRDPRRGVSPTLLVGVAISAGLAVIPAVVTSTPGSLSLTVGLAGVCVTLLVELTHRVEQGQRTANRAFRIIEALDGLPDVASDLEQSATTAAAILRGGYPPLFREAVEQLVAESRLKLDELHRGEYRVRTGSAVVLLGQMTLTKKSIKATSVVTDDEEWWNSRAGQEYWAANLHALANGIDITRVYILDGAPSAQMSTVMTTQRDAGVTVLSVQKGSIPVELLMNIVLFDDNAVYEIAVSGVNATRTLIVNPVYVRTILLKYEELVQYIMQRGEQLGP